eukprot:TRINITY_DN6867_c0_g1_i14.p2 TRINITY_DN6867_c0_g1~~TRINITY_DN6867_c0_g1_i14.p2  ORF type:complete len:170 (+),score=20.70 TRINITY_DN6867_c0_g1_i14:169-678(+)
MFGSQWMDVLSHFRGITELAIMEFNFLTLRTPQDLTRIAECKALRTLKFCGCGGNIPFAFVTLLERLPNIEVLELDFFKNKFIYFVALVHLKKLRKLVVKCVDPFELEEDITVLCQLKQLRYVEFTLRSPYMLDISKAAADSQCEETQKFIQELCPQIRKVVIHGPRRK